MITPDELARINEALGPGVSEKDGSYRPHCLICPTMRRMELQLGRGFQCPHCLNEVSFDLRSRPESRPYSIRTYPTP